MRLVTLGSAAAAVAGSLIILAGGPALAAKQPNEHAPCLAQVFQAQAVTAPQTVSDRILYIRDYELQGDRFGQVLKPLTQFTC